MPPQNNQEQQNVPNEQTNAQNVQTPQISSQNKFDTLKLKKIIIIGVLILVAGVVFIVLRNNNITNNSKIQSSSESENLSWKTYTNEELGFEIKYPLNLVNNPSQTEELLYLYKKDQENFHHPSISIGYFKNDELLPLDVWIKNNSTPKNFMDETVDNSNKLFFDFDWNKVKQIKIGQINGYQFHNSATMSESQDYVLLGYNDKVFYIKSTITNNGNLNEEFNKIFPTFKFINNYQQNNIKTMETNQNTNTSTSSNQNNLTNEDIVTITEVFNKTREIIAKKDSQALLLSQNVFYESSGNEISDMKADLEGKRKDNIWQMYSEIFNNINYNTLSDDIAKCKFSNEENINNLNQIIVCNLTLTIPKNEKGSPFADGSTYNLKSKLAKTNNNWYLLLPTIFDLIPKQ